MIYELHRRRYGKIGQDFVKLIPSLVRDCLPSDHWNEVVLMYACTTFVRCLLKSPIMRMFLFSSILRIQYTIHLKFSMEYFADDVLLGARTLKSDELAIHQSSILTTKCFQPALSQIYSSDCSLSFVGTLQL